MAEPTVWIYLPPTILSAIISLAVAYFTSRATLRRNEWHSRVDDVVETLDGFRDDVLDYWGKTHSAEDLAVLAAKITVTFHDVNEQFTDLRLIQATFATNYIERLLDDAFDLATGNDFNSPNRVIDVHRAQEVAMKVDELRREAHRCRRRSQ